MFWVKRFIERLSVRKRDHINTMVFVGVLCALLAAAGWAWYQYRYSAPYVSPKRYPVRGIDISAHNGDVDLQQVAAEGYRFVFIKASEGEHFRDDNFAINYMKARSAKLRTGAYHFFRFDCDPMQQALNVHRAVQGRYLDLGVAIDVEQHGNPDGYSNAEVSAGVVLMAQALDRLGYHVLIYTNRDGYYDYIEPCEELHDYSVWICSFYKDPLNADWEFWQYNHHGRVKGVSGDVDLNTYSGSLEQWNNLFPGESDPKPRTKAKPKAKPKKAAKTRKAQ